MPASSVAGAPRVVSPPVLRQVQPPAAPAAREHADGVRLVIVRGAQAGTAFRIGAAPAAAGRSEGTLLLPDDPYISPIHATFSFRDGKLHVRDECSDSGTFVPVRDAQAISPGATFVVGDHLLRYLGRLASPTAAIPLSYGAPLPAGYFVRIEELLEGERSGRVWVHAAGPISIGRTGCAVELPDLSVSPRHCELVVHSDAATLRDLGSPEGTLIRMAPGTECTLSPGESLRLGGLLMRVEL